MLAYVAASLFLTGFAASHASAQTYCTPAYTTGCGSDDYIQSFSTTGGSTNITNNNTGCTGTAGQYYSTMGHTGIQNTTVNYSFTNCPGWSEGYKIWVDWDGNGTYGNTANELVYQSATTISAGSSVTGNFTIPLTATPGTTRMRIRCVFASTTFDPCNSQSFGEYEDYNFTVVAATPCTGTPNAGTAVNVPAQPCFNATTQLSLNGASLVGGLAYQWQKWNTVTLAWDSVGTGPTYTTPGITAQSIYRARVTCTNAGGGVAFSVPDTINVNTPVLPYLETFESITSNNQLPNCMVATGAIGSNQYTYTSNQGAGRSNHTTTPTVGSKYGTFYSNNYVTNWFITPAFNLTAGNTYRVKYWYVAGQYTPYFSNLKLAYGTSPTAAGMTTTFSTVNNPSNQNYTQVVADFTPTTSGAYYVGLGATGAGGYDYLSVDDISIAVLPPCSGTPVITMSQPDTVNVCPTGVFTIGGDAGSFSGYTYQWDSSLNGVNWSPIPGANGPTHDGAVAGGTLYYRLNVTCTNSGAATTSSTVVINIVNPQYKPIPYVQSFENWINYCVATDVPDVNFKQSTATGNNAWRRNDQGASAGWLYPTSGSYSPTAQHGSYSARFHSYSAAGFQPLGGFDEGQLDMYLNLTSYTGASAGLYFYMKNDASNLNDSLVVQYSTNGGLTFNYLRGWDTAANWTKRAVNIPGGANTVVRFAARKWGQYDYSDIGIDSVYVALPCSGTPVAGTITPAGPLAACPGSTYSLNLNGTSMAGNLNVQWQYSTTSATGPWTNYASAGATSYNFTTPAILQNTWVRATVTCGTSTTNVATSNVVAITVSSTVTPATLPFTEDFETWQTRCNTLDVPKQAWTNIPSTGNNSWRREDSGSTANWTSLTSGQWWPSTPIAANGNHAARFHNYGTSTIGQKGTLDLYVNATGAGAKELSYYASVTSATYATDSLSVSYSPDGGITWVGLNTINSTTGWQLFTHQMPLATTANTIIRFRASSYYYVNDIGLDYVRVLPACSGAPTAGTIVPVSPCANSNFDLKLTGTSAQGGLTYQWQYVNQSNQLPQPAKASGAWTNGGTGSTSAIWSSNIGQNRWVRAIVTCPGSAQKDTSAPFYIQLAPFYQCYCQSFAYYPGSFSGYGANIGNVTLKTQPANATIFSNGVATPQTNNPTSVNAYTSFTNLTPTPLYQDSTYRAQVTEISYYGISYNAAVAVYIDYNQDGLYDPATERVVATTSSAATLPSYVAAANFKVPVTAKTGVTGMRVILTESYGTTTPPPPCGPNNGAHYYYGETEDYLVEVRFPPCSGAPGAGTALVSDTSICAGYKVTLTDTTYQKNRYGIVRQWQQSTNGGQSWQAIGAANKDTLQPTLTGSTWFRLRVRCSVTGDSAFSNVVTVSQNPPYACYCVSYATGGPDRSITNIDSADIGAFIISRPVSNGVGAPTQLYNFSVGGPHLLNPQAIQGRTDYTRVTPMVELFADSTYQFDVFHILRGTNHKDAKITMFMDFNNNLQYEASPAVQGYPSERVWTAYTGPNDWYKTTTVTIPGSQIITDVPTGMRLILNDNIAANNPSDEACGVYASGETEDYVVIFRRFGGVQGVGGISSLTSLGLFPNPTNGKTSLMFTADKAIKELNVTVTNMTGQVMTTQSFNQPGKQFSTDLDLSQAPRGIYFVELRADGEKAVRKLVVR